MSLRRNRLARLLGVSVPDDEVYAVLSAVSDHVSVMPDGWRVHKPPHRFDMRIEADLIEEVARLRGFDSIEERHAIAPQIDEKFMSGFIRARKPLARSFCGPTCCS